VRPINRQSAIVTSPGVRHVPEPPTTLHWNHCPAITTTRLVEHDFTGMRCGSLFVKGVYAGDTQVRWVVRCTCGRYELRTSKALRSSGNKACQSCSKSGSVVPLPHETDRWARFKAQSPDGFAHPSDRKKHLIHTPFISRQK